MTTRIEITHQPRNDPVHLRVEHVETLPSGAQVVLVWVNGMGRGIVTETPVKSDP